ncbi:hypothetical protein C0991_008451 [Blastosporella zonata]|nr:hypothetical protein C0991_008451 [Blastosporella zonata]
MNMNDAQIFDQLPNEFAEYPMSSIELLERTFCTNFSCCNIVLPDLHALLDHYDVTTSGHSVKSISRTSTPSLTRSPSSSPPSSPGWQSSPESSPPRRYVTLWPAPGPTCTANVTEIAAPEPLVYEPDVYALSEFPTYEHCYDAATSPELQNLKQSLADAIPASVPEIGDKGRRAGPSSAEHKKPSVKRKGKVDLTGVPLATARKRSKKAYQCPTPGCTKSYLNPNGLKYHQEKGTCKIDIMPSTLFPTAAPISAAPVPPDALTNSDSVYAYAPATPTALPAEHQHIHHPQPRQPLYTLVQWRAPNPEQGMNIDADPIAL